MAVRLTSVPHACSPVVMLSGHVYQRPVPAFKPLSELSDSKISTAAMPMPVPLLHNLLTQRLNRVEANIMNQTNLNQTPLRKPLLYASILVLALSTSACGTMSTRGKNTAIGAGIGAVTGAVLTGGSSIGTVGGAAIGGVIGNQIHKR